MPQLHAHAHVQHAHVHSCAAARQIDSAQGERPAVVRKNVCQSVLVSWPSLRALPPIAGRRFSPKRRSKLGERRQTHHLPFLLEFPLTEKSASARATSAASAMRLLLLTICSTPACQSRGRCLPAGPVRCLADLWLRTAPVSSARPTTCHGVLLPRRRMGQQMVGEVARGLSLFGGASSEVRRCNCSVVV